MHFTITFCIVFFGCVVYSVFSTNCTRLLDRLCFWMSNRCRLSCAMWIETTIHLMIFHIMGMAYISALRWSHNGRDSVSSHQPHDCLLNRLFRRGSNKTSKLRVTGLCARNSPGTGEFPAQMASNAENVSIWWRHHDSLSPGRCGCHFIHPIFTCNLTLYVLKFSEWT